MTKLIFTHVVARAGVRGADGEMFAPGSFKFPPTVPVYLMNDRTRYVGDADLFQEGDELKANFHLRTELLTEEMAKMLKPSISGKVEKRDPTNPKILTGVSIGYVSLDPDVQDLKTKRLGEK